MKYLQILVSIYNGNYLPLSCYTLVNLVKRKDEKNTSYAEHFEARFSLLHM